MAENKYAGTQTEKESGGGFRRRIPGEKQVHLLRFRGKKEGTRQISALFFKDGGQ